MPAAVALHETDAVPEPVTPLGVMAPHVSPEGTVSVRLTTPAKWFSAAIVTVEIAKLPALTGNGDVAEIVKSRNWKVAVALRTKGVLVPLIVAV